MMAWRRLYHVEKQLLACGAGASAFSAPCACDTSNDEKTGKRKPAIYLTMGPSGAGKDTLLLGARTELARNNDNNVAFVKRVIQRDASKVTDLEIPVTAEEFKTGDYAIQYFANRTNYAIPKTSLEEGIAAGSRMVLNVSRTVIEQVQQQYEKDRGIEVYCLNITASEAELKRRLQGRGRESAEEIEERIHRAKLLEPKGSHVINIVNEATKEEGIDLCVKALQGKLKYSLWLCPSKDSIFNTAACGEIETLAASHGSMPFAVHITVGKSFVASQREAVEFAQAAAKAIGATVKVNPSEVTTSKAKFRAAVLEIEKSAEILDACTIVRRMTPFDSSKSFHEIAVDVRETYAPHVSFLYGEYDDKQLVRAKEVLRQAVALSPCLSSGFEASELVLVMTSGASYHCWSEVARFQL